MSKLTDLIDAYGEAKQACERTAYPYDFELSGATKQALIDYLKTDWLEDVKGYEIGGVCNKHGVPLVCIKGRSAHMAHNLYCPLCESEDVKNEKKPRSK